MPDPFTTFGQKAAGEGAAIPSPAAIASAVEDALAPLGVCELTGTKDCLLDLPPEDSVVVVAVNHGQEDSDVAVTVVDTTPPTTALPDVGANTPAPGGRGTWVLVDSKQTGGQALNDACHNASVSLNEGTMRVVVSGSSDSKACQNHRYAFSASWSPSAFPSVHSCRPAARNSARNS